MAAAHSWRRAAWRMRSAVRSTARTEPTDAKPTAPARVGREGGPPEGVHDNLERYRSSSGGSPRGADFRLRKCGGLGEAALADRAWATRGATGT